MDQAKSKLIITSLVQQKSAVMSENAEAVRSGNLTMASRIRLLARVGLIEQHRNKVESWAGAQRVTCCPRLHTRTSEYFVGIRDV